jgi:hypothetical protein
MVGPLGKSALPGTRGAISDIIGSPRHGLSRQDLFPRALQNRTRAATSVNARRQGRSYRSKKTLTRDDAAGTRSESAFSLNWISSCLPTICQLAPKTLQDNVVLYSQCLDYWPSRTQPLPHPSMKEHPPEDRKSKNSSTCHSNDIWNTRQSGLTDSSDVV